MLVIEELAPPRLVVVVRRWSALTFVQSDCILDPDPGSMFIDRLGREWNVYCPLRGQ